MNAWKLQLSMVATLAIIFGLTTLVFAVILTWAGIGFSLLTIGVLVVVLNIAQWLLSPYLVGAIYKVKEMAQNENPQLHQMVCRFKQKKRNIQTQTHAITNPTAKRLRLRFTFNRQPSRRNSGAFEVS